MAFKLYYLPLRARAEPIRMILQYGGVPYEDHTVSMAEWPNVKNNPNIAPFGQLPSIILPDGEVVGQSGAIVRYAAKLAKIYPEDPNEALKADMIFELAQEMNMINPILNFWPIETDTWQNNYRSFFSNLPRYLQNIRRLLGNKQFFGGNTPHHGDFGIYHVLDACISVQSDSLDAYPDLVAFMRRIEAIPSIQNYLSIRPPPAQVGLCGSFIQTRIAKVYHHTDSPSSHK